MSQNFANLCKWFENEMSPRTMFELHSKMIELADSPNEVYSMKQMKRKLEVRYAGDIIIGEADGRPILVCFKSTANFFIKKSTEENENENLSESERIVKKAGKLINPFVTATGRLVSGRLPCMTRKFTL